MLKKRKKNLGCHIKFVSIINLLKKKQNLPFAIKQ